MQDFLRNNVVETSLGKTYVKAIGSGPPLIVINGGPGMTHNYLVSPLNFLTQKFTLYFYDQPGCGGTPVNMEDISLEHTANHLCALIDKIEQDCPVSVLAHSWGAVVLMAALQKLNTSRLSEVILINPMPWEGGAYQNAATMFLERLPKDMQAQLFAALMEDSNGDRIMDLLLPYYTPEPIPVKGKDFGLNVSTYKIVNDRLENFSFLDDFKKIENVKIILGAEDFIKPEQIKEVMDTDIPMTILPNLGHFPFYEKPDEFQKALKDLSW